MCKVDSNIELADSLIYDFVESLIKLMVYDSVSKVHVSLRPKGASMRKD